MNYYPHHIGDYLRDTPHLTMIEDGAYRRLIDRYYTTEKKLPSNEQELFRIARARTKEEKEAVRVVVAEFFTLSDGGWSHKRCDAEIERYAVKAERNRKNGSRGGRPPKDKPNINPRETHSVSETKPKKTHTQEPIANSQEKDKSVVGGKPPAKAKFSPPSVEEVAEYCRERGNNIDPQYFVDSNTAKGWRIGKSQTPAKDWKAMVRTWEKNEKQQPPRGQPPRITGRQAYMAQLGDAIEKSGGHDGRIDDQRGSGGASQIGGPLP